MRPQIKLAAFSVLLLVVCLARAEAFTTLDWQITSPSAIERFQSTSLRAVAVQSGYMNTFRSGSLAAMWSGDLKLKLTLPPEPKPTTHWPWWLRILAVIGVLIFIRVVAGAVRTKPSGPGPS